MAQCQYTVTGRGSTFDLLEEIASLISNKLEEIASLIGNELEEIASLITWKR